MKLWECHVTLKDRCPPAVAFPTSPKDDCVNYGKKDGRCRVGGAACDAALATAPATRHDAPEAQGSPSGGER
ncbi:MAG TPA: hypothetical protein VMW93_01665 [bacterium]|nr:hypothetical protein [bacterium]